MWFSAALCVVTLPRWPGDADTAGGGKLRLTRSFLWLSAVLYTGASPPSLCHGERNASREGDVPQGENTAKETSACSSAPCRALGRKHVAAASSGSTAEGQRCGCGFTLGMRRHKGPCAVQTCGSDPVLTQEIFRGWGAAPVNPLQTSGACAEVSGQGAGRVTGRGCVHR